MTFLSPNQQRQSTEGILAIDYHCLNKYNFRFHRIVVSAEAAGRLNPQPSSKNGGSDVLITVFKFSVPVVCIRLRL